jgi:hypothetical protein
MYVYMCVCVYSFTASFGSNDDNIQSLHLLHNTARLVGEKNGTVVNATCQENLVCHFRHAFHRFNSPGEDHHVLLVLNV